jgi:hypothetical protein
MLKRRKVDMRFVWIPVSWVNEVRRNWKLDEG